MKRMLQPQWLFLLSTLPLAIGVLILSAQYQVIQSLLSLESKALWFQFGLGLLIPGFLSFLYGFYLLRTRSLLHWGYGLLSVVYYSGYLYLLLRHESYLLSWDVPRWMLTDDVMLTATTFLMPAIVHGILVIAIHSVPEGRMGTALNSFLAAVALPLGLYFMVTVLLPVLRPGDNPYGEHLMAVLVLGSTAAFFFFVLRGIYILAVNKAQQWRQYELFWKIPIALVFPFLGLMLNNHNWGSRIADQYIFGNFSNPWFYTLAVLNGILVCLPEWPRPMYRLAVLAGRMMTLPFTLYFLLVMLPFLPLALVAILAVGLGFLMLTPLILCVFQVQAISGDWTYLRSVFPGSGWKVLVVLAAFVLPGAIVFQNAQYRNNLHQALEYTYEADFEKNIQIDRPMLLKTLSVIREQKAPDRGVSRMNQPYLSAFFNWMVLDNLSLSDDKLNRMEKLFSGHAPGPVNNTQIPRTGDQGIRVKHSAVKSHYDPEKKAWESQVDLTITADSIQRREFATVFNLPAGAWISDYYLDIGDRREQGILAEKKSATWIYNEITSEQRDPGILHYLTGNALQFRVFPFSKGETRTTGFRLLHAEPMALRLNGQQITLGHPDTALQNPVWGGKAAFVPALYKSQLPKVVRKPYYHFVIDVSANKERNKEWYATAISKLLKNNLIRDPEVRFTLCNYKTQTLDAGQNWQEQLQRTPCEGGYFLDRAMRQILAAQYLQGGDRYPTIVAVTDDISNALIDGDFSDLQFTYPDSQWYYLLDPSGNLNSYSMFEMPKVPQSDSTSIQFSRVVRAWSGPDGRLYYLPENTRSDMVLMPGFTQAPPDKVQQDLVSALYMQGEWMETALNPQRKKSAWLPLLKNSFTTGLLTPVTAWIALENEAQKAALLRKQEQVMSGHLQLDANEGPRRMSEPSLLEMICVLMVGVWLWWRTKARWRVVP